MKNTAHRNRFSREALASRIHSIKTGTGKPAFVAISGFGGTGKSTLAEYLSNTVPGVTVVPIDDFIVGERTQKSEDWSTFDRQRLRTDVLETAQQGRSLRYQCFKSGEWVSGSEGRWREVNVGRIVIVEGCGILHPSLTDIYDLSAWIDCPQDIALEAAIARDSKEINLFGDDDTARLWKEVWGPNDRAFYVKFRPDQVADVLVERQF